MNRRGGAMRRMKIGDRNSWPRKPDRDPMLVVLLLTGLASFGSVAVGTAGVLGWW